MKSFQVIAAAMFAAFSLVAGGQAPKGGPAPDAGERVLSYRGLTPGVDTHEKVLEVLGEPAAAALWYNYKLTYPAEGRDGLVDVVHLAGQAKDAKLASIEAATVPEGYENEPLIREKLGAPEYVLRMATWGLLDYSEHGLRFTVDDSGKTTGVAYFAHGWPRVHSGARKAMDLSDKRLGAADVSAPTSDTALECGVAEVDISPLDDDWLPYTYSVINPLKARIAVFGQGDLRVAIVGADLFGFANPDVSVIRDAVAADTGIDHVILGSSHTHSSGDTLGAYGHYPAKFIGHIQTQIAQGIRDAAASMQPVKAVRGFGEELPMDGTRVQGLIRNARNPGLMDPTLNALQIIGSDGAAMATIVQFACHPESVNEVRGNIDADFPGYMCDKLHNTPGIGQPIFLNGALGGMISGDNPERTHASSKETGERFADLVADLVAKSVDGAGSTEGAPLLTAMTKRVDLPMSNGEWKQRYEGENSRRSLYRGRVVTDMTYVTVGGAQFVTLPGELFPEVSFEILEEMDGFPRMLVGLGNDQLGYMVPAYDFRDGFYEEKTSVGAATASEVRDTAIRMIRGQE